MLSICTPTYNRAYTLKRVYQSLLEQSDKEFEWVIIDDGSSDGTKELVEKFKEENKIHIIYSYHTNQGKHMSLDKAYKLSNFEYILCLDSDDWLVESAVEVINKDYNKFIKKSNKIAGAVYLDKFEDGKILGTELPENEIVNWIDLKHKSNMQGDKCYVFKKSVLINYPFITFDNNKHMPPTYQFYLISRDYDMLTVNTPLKVVEYLEDGITNNVKKNYFTSAENYAYFRKIINYQLPTLKEQIKNIILYNVSYINSNRNDQIKLTNDKTKLISKLLLPISLFLSFYYKKVRKVI